MIREHIAEDEGGRDVATFEELIAAVQEWFTYDRMEESPFPSKEPPVEAARRWYQERLRLTVEGRNRFKMACPGCGEQVEFETNGLHTKPMFDYAFWEYCPTCSTALDDDEDEGA